MTIWVIDYKSSTGVWDEMKTQVCIYWFMAQKEFHPEKCGVLRLDKETGLLDNPPIVECKNGEISSRIEGFMALRRYYELIIEPTLSEKKMERFYKHDGKRYPTVTTILDLLNKPE